MPRLDGSSSTRHRAAGDGQRGRCWPRCRSWERSACCQVLGDCVELPEGLGDGVGVLLGPQDGFSIDRGGFLDLDDVHFFQLPNKSGTIALTSDVKAPSQGPAGPAGPRGPQGPQGPPGRSGGTSSAACMPGRVVNNCDAVCSGSTVVAQVLANGCRVTSDTGSCGFDPVPNQTLPGLGGPSRPAACVDNAAYVRCRRIGPRDRAPELDGDHRSVSPPLPSRRIPLARRSHTASTTSPPTTVS